MKIDHEDPVSDVLTTVLNALQFQGKVFCYTKLTSPWALRLKRKEYAHFHFFERGQGWVELEETGAEIGVVSGDLVIVPNGRPHVMRDSRKTKAVYVEELLPCRDVLTLRHGGGGSETTTVCGAFTFENRIGNPILPLLPDLIHIPREKIHSAVWLESMLRLLTHEAQNPREGSGSIIGHLTGIIFVQAVRAWIESQPDGQGGWLGALRDKQISSVLTLMHQKPNEHWTIARLASEIGMSRSPFCYEIHLSRRGTAARVSHKVADESCRRLFCAMNKSAFVRLQSGWVMSHRLLLQTPSSALSRSHLENTKRSTTVFNFSAGRFIRQSLVRRAL